MARTHPDLVTGDPPNSPTGVWVANSLILYVMVALILIQNCFPWLGIGATFQMRLIPAVHATTTSAGGPIDVIGANGQPVQKTPQVEVTTNQPGPAWDTLFLLGIWAWAGVACLRRSNTKNFHHE